MENGISVKPKYLLYILPGNPTHPIIKDYPRNSENTNQDTGFKIQDSGYRTQDARCTIQDAGF
jgi:hypothetical protein